MATTEEIRSKTEMFPTFPYFTDEQQPINAPDYAKAAESAAQICHRYDLIDSWKWDSFDVVQVMFIQALDGEQLILSDMQALVFFKGLLKGYKRLRENELDIEPLLRLGKPMQRKTRTQLREGGSKPKTKPSDSTIPNAEYLAERSEKAKAELEVKRLLDQMKGGAKEEKEEDNSWIDDVFDDFLGDE